MDNAGIVEFVKQQEEKLAHSDAPDGVFYPILPQQVGRYDVAKRMKGSHSTIEPGMFIAARAPVPQYLPEHWSSLTHPEGALYFCRNSRLRVITSSYLYDRTIADKLMSWVQYLEKRAAEKTFEMTESVELYVQLEDNNCNYYFVDHASRALFWLDDYETSELGLLPVVSPSHLRLQLEEQYWLHLEYYCMHQVPLKTNIIEETISTLTHGYGDQLTSTSSTFPYDAADCKKFLKLLVPQRDRMHDGRVLCIAARLNSVFALNKYWTYYGQEQARLSKDVSMLADEMEEVSWTQPVLSTATFGASRFFHSRLNENFTDSYVYTADWKKMIPSFIGKWKSALHLSLGFLMLHVLCFYLPVSETLAFISAACLGLSMLSSVLLIHSYEDMQNLPCHEAYSFLSGNRLAKFKFQHLALLFALPQALNLWGLLVMFAQLATFVQPFHLASAAVFVVVSIALAKIFQQIRSSSFFSRAKKSDEDRV